MRIVSDFDGVWTNQAGEAEAIRAGFARDAAALMGVPETRARAEFDGFLARTHAEPHLHGWWPRGHLTAFVDEDELLATGAVSVWLDRATDDPVATRWLDALRAAGHETAEDFANQQFGPAMRAHRRTGQHRLVPEARAVLDAVLGRGDELVIVSNSPNEKIRAMFREIGADEGDGLRFVGDAKKWWVDDPAPKWTVAGRDVLVDRPLYRGVLEELRPDVLIGDVASLDLAMAAVMRAEGRLSTDLRLLLRTNPSSSRWAVAQTELARDARLVDEAVDSITALVG